jgi:hypothetical protein
VSKTYDGGLTYTTAPADLTSLSGALVGGDLVSSATLAFTNKNAGAANKAVTFSGVTLNDGNGGNNYNVTLAGNSISTITPASVTLSAPVVSKTYDGGLTYTTAPADLNSLSGALVGGDLVSAATLAFTNKNAGAANKAVTLSSVTLNDGNGGGNYNVTLAGNSISTITPASVTLSAPVVSKTYDGGLTYTTTPADLTSLSGALVGGDLVSAATLAFTNKNAGAANKAVTLSGVTLNDGNGGNNYNVTLSGNSISTITPASVTLSAPVVSKTYDGGLTYTTAPADLTSLSGALVGGDLVSSATLAFTNKNAGAANKAVTFSGVTLNDGNGGNNYNVTLSGNSISTITPASVTLNAPAVSKTYDGTTSYTTTAADLLAMSTVLASGDSVATASLTYADKNAGSGNKVVSLGALTINDGNGGANYTVTTNGNTNSTINPLTVTWTGNAGTSWSSTGNWSSPFVPDGVNVITPQTLNVTNAVYDLTVPTSVQAISASGSFTLQSGALTINGDLITPSYSQSGGTLSVSGALTVQSVFSQTGGDIVKTGPVSITQASGNLAVRNITGSSITLQAPTGAITQQPSTGLTGFLIVKTRGGANFSDPSNNNTLSGFAVSDVGLNVPSSGNISLINNGALDLKGISLANGNLSIETHSPITVSSPVNVSGNITLAAPTPGPTSNITINSPMTSTMGGISISAANNFIQNSNLSAALAIDVNAGGSMFFGPGAYSVGNPVTYMVNGAPYMPPWIASTLSGGATDFVVAFLDQFQAVLDAQQVASNDDPLGLKQRGHEGIVVEGEICKP